jgi:hypothetical protein
MIGEPQETADFEPIEVDERAPATVEQDINDFADVEAEPISKNMGLNKTRNGYYVLNTQKYSRNQVPMYVYYGDSPPPGSSQA